MKKKNRHIVTTKLNLFIGKEEEKKNILSTVWEIENSRLSCALRTCLIQFLDGVKTIPNRYVVCFGHFSFSSLHNIRRQGSVIRR